MPFASASESGPESTSPQCGFSLRLVMPHLRPTAKLCSSGNAEKAFGSWMSELRGGSSDAGCFLVPRFSSAMFCGASTNSIHFQAASGFLLCDRMTSASPAIVLAHWLPSVSVGSGAAAHLPLILGKLLFISPANQAPAMYMPTLPV